MHFKNGLEELEHKELMWMLKELETKNYEERKRELFSLEKNSLKWDCLITGFSYMKADSSLILRKQVLCENGITD